MILIIKNMYELFCNTMSKQQIVSVVERKIAAVNRAIDYKIMRGKSYAAEAMEHRLLLSQMRRLKGPGFFTRSLSFMHLL